MECQCDPPCLSAAACRQKRSRAARRAAAIALAVGAVGAALVGARAVGAAAAALAARSRLQTPVKRPAPPTQMAPPRKATKQSSLFETLQAQQPQAPRTVKVQDVASAVLWFRSHSAFEGDALATAWNSAQKAAAVMVKEYPRAVCVELHDRYVAESTAKPPVKPHLTSELKQYPIIMGKSLAPMPSEGTARGFLGPVPSLQVLCAKVVLPEVNFSDVVQAMLHFAALGLNYARAAAKELRAAHSTSRVHCFCAVARVEAHFELPPVVPAWFPEIVGLQSTARAAAAAGCDAEAPLKEWQRKQDIGKLRIAVHLLKHTRLDTHFGPLVTLLQDCDAPGFQHVFGSGRKHAQQLINYVVSRELSITATGLLDMPMWGLIIDGAHKKAMPGAPDIVKCRFIDMSTGTVHLRHAGLITPRSEDFFQADSQEFIERPQSADRLAAQF